MARLTGKVAIITGGAGGIGRAAARIFVEEGAKVLLVDLDEGALQAAVAGAGGGDSASYVVADTTEPDQVQRFVDAAVERYGGVDVFLANAGIEGRVLPIPEYPIDVFDRVMAVNVRGVWLGLRSVIPAMHAARWRQHRHHRVHGRHPWHGRHLGVHHQQARRDRADALGGAGVRLARHPGQHRQPGPDRDPDDALAGAAARRAGRAIRRRRR